MLKKDLDDFEKEICQEIREQLPEAWGEKDDTFIYNFCTAVPQIEELCGNKGYTVKAATRKVIEIMQSI